MWPCRIVLNVMVNSEEIHYFFQLVKRWNLAGAAEDWTAKGGYILHDSHISRCLEVDTCSSSKLSIYLKYLVTGMKFLLLFLMKTVGYHPRLSM